MSVRGCPYLDRIAAHFDAPLLLVYPGVTGILEQSPQNSIGLADSRIVLNCSSNTSSSSITWAYDSAVIASDCSPSLIPSFKTVADSQGKQCSLQADALNSTILSGPYSCSDGSGTNAQAVVIIIGKFSSQFCKARSCDHMSSVRPSVRLSVTLVDCDYICWKSLKLIAQTISPTPSLFVAKTPSTNSQGNPGTAQICWVGYPYYLGNR